MLGPAEAWLRAVAAGDLSALPPTLPYPVAVWLDAHPCTRTRATGRDRVAYDTPWETARDLAAQTWSRAPDRLVWWGDPCVGIGRLLLAGWEAGLEAGRAPVELLQTLVASDPDAAALHVARQALAHAVVQHLVHTAAPPDVVVAVARAWQASRWETQDALTLLPTRRGPAVVLTNPPFVSMRQLHRTIGAAGVQALRRRDPRLVGAFDLGVPIVLAALDAAVGGAAGLVLPAPWRSVRYAAPLRAQLEAWGTWHDRPAARFHADVHTWTTVGVAHRSGASRLVGPAATRSGEASPGELVLPLGAVPLSQIAQVRGGTTGFVAARVGAWLQDGERPLVDPANGWPWVATGHIHPLQVLPGPARWQGVYRQHPWLPRQAVEGTALADWYDRPRLLVTGVCRSLQVAPVVTAAQAVGVWGVATDAVPLAALACCLMAPSAQAYVLARHPGTQLRGGYRRWSAAMVRSLPVPSPHDPVYAEIVQVLAADTPDAGISRAEAWWSRGGQRSG